MSDIKLPQGSDYHGDGKLFFKEDSYREKFPKGSNWKESDGNKHGVEIIGMDIKKYKQSIAKIERLERELKDARECNNVKDKYWKNIRIELNRYRNKKDFKFLGEQYIEELEDKIKELETELYFCNRNKRVGEIVDGY